MTKFQLSILDQSQIRRNATAHETLIESGKLAQLAESLGYKRFWVSEHHNFKLVAGSAPEVLIPYLASQTKKIRIGSGGIMLPNHSALKMAENFGIIENLFPGRIDLGLGRAPGGDRLSAYLLNPANTFSEKDFIESLYQLKRFLKGDNTPDTVHEKVKAYPLSESIPDLWILTSSGGSASFAAQMGMGMSFAHFINPEGGSDAVEFYKHNFRPSDELKTPQVKVSIFGFCSDNLEKISDWITDFQYRMLHIEMGAQGDIPDLETIKKMNFSFHQKARMAFNSGRFIAGTPEQMEKALQKLSDTYETDEIMIATPAESWEDRKKSYELFAQIS